MNYPKPEKIENLPNSAAAPVYFSVPQYRKYKKHHIEPSGGTTLDFALGNGTAGSGARNLAIGIGIIVAVGAVAYLMHKNRKNR